MTETRRLYYEDVYKKEFTATVVECREQKKGYAVVLDESAFYPEGGGQPSDVGTLGDAKVTEVHEKDGELLHYTDKALEVGAKVEGKIDWARRFDLMQQHSGEHIVSGWIHRKYGYDNVGFHMGEELITIDLNGLLDEGQLHQIEQEVNDYIAAGGIPRLNPEYQPFMTVLFFIVSVPPVIGCILSVLPTIKYALSDKEHKRILDELNERRHAAEN